MWPWLAGGKREANGFLKESGLGCLVGLIMFDFFKGFLFGLRG